MNKVKLPKLEGPLFLYGGACLAVALSFGALSLLLPQDGFIHTFLFNCWPIQFISSWLFVVGLAYWVQRFSLFRSEEEAFQKAKLPDFTINRIKAMELVKSMPEKYSQTLTMRRFKEILQALSYGEDIVRLNAELSRRDMAEVESGHTVLNSLRNIIPVLGFLGTVIGLSFGMIKFPNLSNIEALRDALKDFAASLSVGFDTTLVALGYTIVIILLTSFLRQREEQLVTQIDERARMLIAKIKVETTPTGAQVGGDLTKIGEVLNDAIVCMRDELSLAMKGFLEKFAHQNNGNSKQLEEVLKENGKILFEKLEHLGEAMHRPPHYQIIVQPLSKGEGSHEK
jgi:biopolymer transport protein ExbB/TolQ